jgi:integrase
LKLPPQLRRYLICNRRGQLYTLNGFQSQWRRTMNKALQAGLAERFHFHDLRAKRASDAESDQAAADRLGHGDVELTRRVYRRLPRRGWCAPQKGVIPPHHLGKRGAILGKAALAGTVSG